jgi:photosystem II stability/assembly factor-like uncharacterized protein
LASKSLLLDVAAAGDRFVAVGERGHVLLSDDDGESWRQVVVPTKALLTAVYFADPEHGWAVGHDAAILRTEDGGETWELVHFAPEEERPFLDVWFEDSRRGFAIGAYGFFFRSEDGGASWSSIPFEPESSGGGEAEGGDDYEYDYYDLAIEPHLNQVAQSADHHYIAAEAGSVFRSDDGADTWLSLPSPYEGSFFGVLPLEEDAVLLLGLRGHLFRSEDAGESWQEVPTGTNAMLTCGLRLDDGTVIVGGLAGTLLVSRDAGLSFELIQLPDRRGISALAQAAGDFLVAAGEGGVRRLSPEEYLQGTGR